MIPQWILKHVAKQVWVNIIYPVLKKQVAKSATKYDDTALEAINQVISNTADILGV
ncbi:MAG: hypothetical protein [Arizlama microvirus]|nr:MAG: hypothetical protein [Arizlama microvirus]